MDYNYNRPIRDTRYKTLSAKEDVDMVAGIDGKALNLFQSIDEYERKFLEYLVKLHNSLRKDVIDIDEVQGVLEVLTHMKSENENEYLKALLRPETAKGAKIPAMIPVPSSSFQLHNTITISTNSTGNACLVFNPFYLATSGTNSSLYLNNDSSLTGSASSNFFKPVNIGQVVPPVYNQYRVVSASIVVKYVGRLDIVQGVIGGAVVFDSSVSATDYSTAPVNAAIAKYGDFNLAMDAYYTQENLLLNGIRELYFPLDNTYEQYTNTGISKNGFNFLIYILNSVPSASYYKVDIFVNYECLPDAAFLNYLPVQSCTCSPYIKEEAVRRVQEKPITTADNVETGNRVGFWDRIKGVFGKALPSIANIASNIFPGIKPFVDMTKKIFE